MPMPAWTDIFGLTPNDPEDKKGFEIARGRIVSIIEQEIAKGVSPNRIILGGFSQGAAVAYYTGLLLDKSLGGLLILSGWIPLRDVVDEKATDQSKQTEIIHHHGAGRSLMEG